MRPAREPAVSVDLVRILLRRSSEAGLDPGATCRAAGIDAACLDRRGARVPSGRFAQLWHAIARRSRDPAFGLHFGADLAGAASGHLFLAVLRSCATVGDALRRVQRYHDLLAGMVQLGFREEPGVLRVVWAPAAPALDDPDILEAVLATFVTTFRHLTDGRFAPVEVRFRHRRPRRGREHARVLCGPVRFGASADEVVISRAALGLPLASADGELLLALEPLAEAELARLGATPSWAGRTARVVREVLVEGRAPGVALVAARLSLRPRTLQARLGGEATSYRRVLDEVRHALAISLVERGDVPLPDVASRVGFAEQSALNHAFRRWTGTSPRAFRRRHGAALQPLTPHGTPRARGGGARGPRGSPAAPR